MLAWWQMNSGFFRDRTCEHLIAAGLQIPMETAVVGFGSQVRNDQELRRSQVRWVHKGTKGFEHIWVRLEEIFHEMNNAAFGFNLSMLTEVQFTEYKAADKGHYGWHEDVNWVSYPPQCYHRKLSMVIQLSDPDEYEGGDLVLGESPPAPAALRRRGTFIVFPSFLQHKVTPVTKGTRYSLVAWIAGPQFR